MTPTLRHRLDSLTDRQCRILLFYLVGRWGGDSKFASALREGVDWLKGTRSEEAAHESGRTNHNQV
jgi:hypothetical protein